MGPAGSFTPTAISQFAFGVGPFQHYEAPSFVLETTAANSLTLRRTGQSGIAVTFSMTYPTGCTGNAITGTANAGTSQVHRITFGTGDAITATFCGEGSVIRVTVFDEFLQDELSFRCWRVSGNSNACRQEQ